MWFDTFDPGKANATIDHIANWDSSTDWGMRVISEQHPLFEQLRSGRTVWVKDAKVNLQDPDAPAGRAFYRSGGAA